MSCITTVTGKHFDPTLRERCIQLQRVLRYEAKMREAEPLLRTSKNADRLQSLIGELETYYTATHLVKAEMLDIDGSNAEAILQSVIVKL